MKYVVLLLYQKLTFKHSSTKGCQDTMSSSKLQLLCLSCQGWKWFLVSCFDVTSDFQTESFIWFYDICRSYFHASEADCQYLLCDRLCDSKYWYQNVKLSRNLRLTVQGAKSMSWYSAVISPLAVQVLIVLVKLDRIDFEWYYRPQDFYCWSWTTASCTWLSRVTNA